MLTEIGPVLWSTNACVDNSTQQTGVVRRSLHLQHPSLFLLHIVLLPHIGHLAWPLARANMPLSLDIYRPDRLSTPPPSRSIHDFVLTMRCAHIAWRRYILQYARSRSTCTRSFSLISMRGSRRCITIIWGTRSTATSRCIISSGSKSIACADHSES